MKLKMLAIAIAAMSVVGTAQAALEPAGTANGDLVLTAYNITNNAWYMRDTGFNINTFLPSSITTLPGDGGLTGDKTPEAGLTLNAGNTATFADASFGTWLAGQGDVAANVRWMVTSVDTIGTSNTDRRRMIVSSANNNEVILNSNLDSFFAGSGAGNLGAFFGANPPGTLSNTGTGMSAYIVGGAGLGADARATIGGTASLFYAVRSTGTGSTTLNTTQTRYGNTTGFATVSLDSAGNFSYLLEGAPVGEVPLPASVWLMGAGLAGIGGFIRRRKAAAQA